MVAELALSEYYNLVLAEQDIYPHHACLAVVELVFYPYDENGVGQDAYPYAVLKVVAVLDACPHDEVEAVQGAYQHDEVEAVQGACPHDEQVEAVQGGHGHHDILLDLLHQLSLPH